NDAPKGLKKEASDATNGAPATVSKAPKKKKQASAKKSKKKKKSKTKPKEAPKGPKGTTLEKIKGTASKVVENMNESLELPTATSSRTLPMKMLIEDRAIINRQLLQRDRKSTRLNSSHVS